MVSAHNAQFTPTDMIKWYRNSGQQQAADTIYAAIVAQARRPEFYEKAGAPDTLDGRFDLLIMHAFLYFHRLKGEGEEAHRISQLVFDAMFADLDQNLREMGVGDMSIGKKVRGMGSAFYGRTSVYDEGLEVYEAHPSVLVEAVKRNVFPESADDRGATAIAAYMKACVNELGGQETSDLLQGVFSFAEPDLQTA